MRLPRMIRRPAASLLLSATASLLTIPPTASADDDVVALFRAFRPDDVPAWATAFDVKGNARYDDTSAPSWTGAIPEGGSWPYARTYYKFDGSGDYLRLRALANADADDGLTLRAWFRPAATDGNRTVFSNTNGGGFALRVIDGHVTGTVRVANQYYTVTSSTAARQGKWNQATFVVDLDNLSGATPMLRLTLLLNGERTASDFPVDGSVRIENSDKLPLIGAEPNATGEPTSQFFKGDIEGVVVRNYPIESTVPGGVDGEQRWLALPPPDDSTYYGGEPSYWDHVRHNEGAWTPYESLTVQPNLPLGCVVNTSAATLDQRLLDPVTDKPNPDGDYLPCRSGTFYDPAKINILGFVPFINNDYVVQGLTSTCEGKARCTDERLYLSMYWHSAGDANDPDGKTAAEANLSRSNRSLIVKIDPSKSTRPLACYKLTGYLATSHVAGLGKRGDDLYVIATDGGSYIERYKIPDGETTTTCVDIAPTGRWPVVTGGSLSIVGDAVLVTDYASSSQADTPYLYVYRLDASGAVSTDYKTKYLLPRIAEGVVYYDPTNNSTPFAPDDDAQLLVAQVSGIVRRYSARTLKNKAGSGDPTLPATTAPSLLVPRGVQDMTFNGTQIWMASESGSKFIQRSQAKGWPELFPFVFSASPSPSGWR